MTKAEIERKEKEQAKLFRNVGYTFRSLVQAFMIQNNELIRMKERLLYIDKMNGKICMCSAMVNDQEKEGNTVPYLWCIISDKTKSTCLCPYVEASNIDVEHALELQKELHEDK